MRIIAGNYRVPPRYILRTHKKPEAVAGCTGGKHQRKAPGTPATSLLV